MRMVKFLFGLCSLIIALGCLNGCQGPRFVHAKVTPVAPTMTFAHNPVLILHESINLTDAEKAQAQQLREVSKAFYADKEKDLEVYGDINGPFKIYMLAVSQNQPGSTFPLPTEFAIFTTSWHRKGEAQRNGYAEIRFGSDGPVYTTDKPSDTFFEFTVSDTYQENGDWIASGNFSMIAKNKTDSSDNTRLFVMDGAFITRVKNH